MWTVNEQMFDHCLCRRWWCTIGLRRKPLDLRSECRPPGGILRDCCASFILWFWVFQMDEKKLCVLRISGERDGKTSVLLGLRSMPVWKNKVLHALDFVSINLLFRGKHKCFGRQLLWPFVLGIVYQTLKGFITLTAGGPFFPSRKEEKEERRNSQFCGFIALIGFFFWFCFFLSCDIFLATNQMLKFGHARVLPLCCGRSSRGWEPAERSSISACLVGQRFWAGLQQRSSGWSLSSGSCSLASAATGEEQTTFSHSLCLHRSSEGRSLLVSDLFKCVWFHFGQEAETVKTTSCRSRWWDLFRLQQEWTDFLLQRNLTFSCYKLHLKCTKLHLTALQSGVWGHICCWILRLRSLPPRTPSSCPGSHREWGQLPGLRDSHQGTNYWSSRVKY